MQKKTLKTCFFRQINLKRQRSHNLWTLVWFSRYIQRLRNGLLSFHLVIWLIMYNFVVLQEPPKETATTTPQVRYATAFGQKLAVSKPYRYSHIRPAIMYHNNRWHKRGILSIVEITILPLINNPGWQIITSIRDCR